MNEILLIAKDLGLGAIAIGCGIVAIVNGKDKVDKISCQLQISKFSEEFTNSKVQFGKIDERLKDLPEMKEDIKKILIKLGGEKE